MSRDRLSKLAPLALTLLLGRHAPLADTAFAQPIPLGSSFPVSAPSPGVSWGPDVARRPDGGFVVVWQDSSREPSEAAVLGRRFGPAGEPLGPEFAVSASETGYYRGPHVASGVDGGFLVVWQSGEWNDQDAWGRAFAPDGTPYGNPFRLHPVLPGGQQYPAVASDPAGGFVVAWSYRRPDGYPYGARARRFDAEGVPVAPPFALVAEYRGGARPSLGAVGPGEFVVAYQAKDYGSGYQEVWARTFSATGAVDPEFRVDDGASSYGTSFPRLAVDPGGGFLVTWSDFHFHFQTPRGRRFDAAGDLLAEIEIDQDTSFTLPAFAPDGTWYLVWHETTERIRAQFHAPDGTPVGAAFDIELTEEEPEWLETPQVAFDAASNPIFVGGTDSSAEPGDEIRARLYLAGGLFLDGFESGDASRWSASVP